jgi:peptide/nickel transport system ATP-binding protein/oligopeptide transport system ATP-binding protein
MYLGRIVEMTQARMLYQELLHLYTIALLSAVPIADPFVDKERKRVILKGEVPSPLNPPPGCSFHPRCFQAIPECSHVVPPLREVGGGHQVACIRV